MPEKLNSKLRKLKVEMFMNFQSALRECDETEPKRIVEFNKRRKGKNRRI
ncbi:MAG: hypothetical protein IMF11_18310 [Proteobacteria bacterium]|nr:hypothetical protein [Pseudomonadota bacterium]